MILFANAKINLGLRIVGKRDDGFHNIETIFYPVPYYDVMEFHPSDRFDLHLYGEKISGAVEDNLVSKAFRLIHDRFCVPGLEVHLMKNIPEGSGLGGGSSDAAHLLSATNSYFQLGQNNEQLKQLAGNLGSDCPFFIDNKPAFASGKGDVFEEIDLDLKGYFLVLAFPAVRIETKAAYAMFQNLPNHQDNLRDAVGRPLENWQNDLTNDFEEVLFPQYPELAALKNELTEIGAVYASLTGSGSTVYGIFKNKPQLKKVKSGIRYQLFRL